MSETPEIQKEEKVLTYDEYAFDAWGNVTGISFGAADGEIRSMGYSYDMNDRRIQTYLPDGTSWRYGYFSFCTPPKKPNDAFLAIELQN